MADPARISAPTGSARAKSGGAAPGTPARSAGVAPAAPAGPPAPVTPSDPRSAAIHAKLYAAAEALGASGAAFSVAGLTREAGVSRSVFYVHFADLRDFALHLQQTRFHEIAAAAEVERGANASEAMLQANRRLVAHFSANRQLYRAVFALGGTSDAQRGTAAEIRAALLRHISIAATLPPGIAAELVASYFAYAVTGILADWLNDPAATDEESLALHLFALLPPWLYGGSLSSVGSTDGD
ncbi:TetR/AcrR family transcriptional regulator [Leucobacter luti]|uniref:TetR family transcriptional regulator n=1 Tax=Leucobacter luti TaxID=340320 RepID=A0A4Q7U5D5_9MICO|nr:TetR/AcrR family transcriptional regulator [Leucobacter luti]MBL3700920.1 TetR/AcrR family transcriptional regulator [Leucobacter luti]RZT68861.1 TetR family transcriptional regulator [Leucobacter luti]